MKYKRKYLLYVMLLSLLLSVSGCGIENTANETTTEHTAVGRNSKSEYTLNTSDEISGEKI